MEWITNLTGGMYWNWLALGIFLAMFEMVIPGAAMLWTGAAALVTGVIVWLFPDIDWKWQIIMFSLLGIAGVMASRRVFGGNRESSDSSLNNRSEQLVGRITTLETAIENGQGRARIGDSSWMVSGPDLPAGTKVRVIDADGAALQVERAV